MKPYAANVSSENNQQIDIKNHIFSTQEIEIVTKMIHEKQFLLLYADVTQFFLKLSIKRKMLSFPQKQLTYKEKQFLNEQGKLKILFSDKLLMANFIKTYLEYLDARLDLEDS